MVWCLTVHVLDGKIRKCVRVHNSRAGVGTVSVETLQKSANRVIGQKQTLKAVEKGLAATVYIAEDAEEHVVRDIRTRCQELGVRLVTVESMSALGKACGIEVGAAAAAVVKARF